MLRLPSRLSSADSDQIELTSRGWMFSVDQRVVGHNFDSDAALRAPTTHGPLSRYPASLPPVFLDLEAAGTSTRAPMLRALAEPVPAASTTGRWGSANT